MCDDSRGVSEAIARTRKRPEAGGEPIAYCDGKPSMPLQCMEGEHKRRESRKAGMGKESSGMGKESSGMVHIPTRPRSPHHRARTNLENSCGPHAG